MKMSSIQSEKSMLEQLILEILSFGEQCDLQFEQLQEKMNVLSTEQMKQNRFDVDFIGKLRQAITDKVKAIIVEVEDKKLRDNMIEVLSSISQYQNNGDGSDPLSSDFDHTIFEKAFAKIVEGLGQSAVSREKEIADLRQELGRKEELMDQLAKCEAELRVRTKNLDDSKEQYRKLREQIHDHDIFVKKIQTSMREHNYIIKTNSKLIDSKRSSGHDRDPRLDTETSAHAEPNLQLRSFESVCRQLPKDLGHINQWAQDQILLLQNYICDREKLVQLNLKCNELTQQNSRLKIENDKQKMINEKYRSSVILRTDQSP